MSDLYSQVVNSPPGRMIAGRVGLPQPTQLERYEPGAPVVSGAVLSGGAPRGRLGKRLEQVLGDVGAAQTGDLRLARSRRSSSTPPASPTRPSWSSCSASSTPT